MLFELTELLITLMRLTFVLVPSSSKGQAMTIFSCFFRFVSTSFLILTAFSVLTLTSYGQEKDAQDQQELAEKVQKAVELELEFQSMFDRYAKADKEGYVTDQLFDINKDGTIDLELRTKPGRGALSTYYVVSKLVAVNGAKILKHGTPQDEGASIEFNDLFAGTGSVILCNVGGSLRFPDRSFEDFCSGNWWGKSEKGLALFIPGDNQPEAGFAKLTVTKRGVVSFGEPSLKPISMPKVEFK